MLFASIGSSQVVRGVCLGFAFAFLFILQVRHDVPLVPWEWHRRLIAGNIGSSHAEIRPAEYYHDLIYNYSHSHLEPAWMILHTVDGFKNEEVVLLVTSSASKGAKLLRERIIGSSRTWMRYFAHVFVIIEDTFEARFAMRHCERQEYSIYTVFSCNSHHEPQYILSRNCSSVYYQAEGICCKVDDGINFLVNVAPAEWFATIKYVLQSDDDEYWRPDQVLRWLAAVERAGVSQYPIVANKHPGEATNRGDPIWHISGCNEVHMSGWYQPVMFNKAALVKLRATVSSYGFRDTCRAFDVSQDVGIGIVAWLMELYHIQIPNVQYGKIQPKNLAKHYARHMGPKDDCGDESMFRHLRYKQDVVLGCGTLDQAIPGHNLKNPSIKMDHYDMWKYFKALGEPSDIGVEEVNEFLYSPIVVAADGHTLKYVLVNSTEIYIAALQHFKTHHSIGNIYLNHANDSTTAKQGLRGTIVSVLEGHNYTMQEGESLTLRLMPRLMLLAGYQSTTHSRQYNLTQEWHTFNMSHCRMRGKIINYNQHHK